MPSGHTVLRWPPDLLNGSLDPGEIVQTLWIVFHVLSARVRLFLRLLGCCYWGFFLFFSFFLSFLSHSKKAWRAGTCHSLSSELSTPSGSQASYECVPLSHWTCPAPTSYSPLPFRLVVSWRHSQATASDRIHAREGRLDKKSRFSIVHGLLLRGHLLGSQLCQSEGRLGGLNG